MGMLTKQQVVMSRIGRGIVGAYFAETLDEPGFTRSFSVGDRDYREMGYPEVITVTIEPGNHLNEAE